MLKKAFLGHLEECKIVEARDGLEAVELCKNNKFDFIFMDIMMPNMDGVEAIRQIRRRDPYVLLIAISSLDDNKTLQDALKTGAVDYMHKPFDATLLERRVYNYLSLANYRRFISGDYSSVSLFCEPVFKRTILFHIRDEDELAEFWEFFLTHYTIVNSDRFFSKDFYPAIKVGFDIVEILLKQNKKTTIVYESNDVNGYLTIGPIRVLNQTLLKEIFEHKKEQNKSDLEALFCESRFSLKFKKYADNPEDVMVGHPTNIVELKPKESAVESRVIYTEAKPAQLVVVDFFDEDEKTDFSDAICNLEMKLSVLQYSSKLEVIDALEIADALAKISSALYPHTVFADVAVAFKSLSLDIQEEPEEFVNGSTRMSKLLKSFVDDLKDWENKLFRVGIERYNIMNDTLIADTQQISMISAKRLEDGDHSVDNIFF
jgi:two-component system chemotaxis response regulator CheY